MTSHDYTTIAAFADESVMLLSRRFGWIIRARHQLSFSSIGTLAIEPLQFLIFIFGNWSGRAACSAVCLIDGRTGQLLLYFEHPDKPDEEEIMKRQIKTRHTEINVAEDLNKGIIDQKGTKVKRLLRAVTPRLPETTYEQGKSTGIEVKLEVDSSVAERLFDRYQDSRGGADLPLTLEFSIEGPEGNRRLVPFDATSLEEVGPAVVALFETDFRHQGNHILNGSIFLAGSQVEIPSRPLAVRKLNPFSTMLPLRDEWLFLFKGHEQACKYCSDFTTNNGNLLVCGSRRFGKSSFLYYLADRFRAERNDVATVLFSCDSFESGRGNLSYFEHLFLELGSDEWARRATGVQPGKYSFNNLNEVDDALTLVGEHLKRTLGPSARLVVLADEFNALIERNETAAVDQIGSKLTKHPWFRQVAAGLPNIGKLDKTESSGMSRYTGNKYFLQPLNRKEVEELATEPLLGRFDISVEALDRVVVYSSGRPHDVQNLMYHAVNFVNEKGRREIKTEDIDRSLNTLVDFYGSYLAPFDELERTEPEVAEAWLADCQTRAGMDAFYNLLNVDDNSSNDPGFKPFFKWGYVRGQRGDRYNVPYALLSAWVGRETKQEKVSHGNPATASR